MNQKNTDDMVVPRPQARLRVGVTGHRIGPKFSQAAAAEVRATIDGLLAEIARLARVAAERDAWAFASPRPILSMISALAEGSDRIVAEAGLAAGLPLSVILPFARADYRRDFESEESRGAFDSLLARASTVFEIDGRRETAARSYEAAGLLMLANADIVIAIWDQMPADGIGGTALIVEHAVADGVPVILIDPSRPAEPSILWRGDVPLPTARTSIEELPRRSLAVLLPDVISILLAPPGGGPERSALHSLFAEKRRRWNFAVSYPILMSVIGVRMLRWVDLNPANDRQDGATRWRDYLSGESPNGGMSQVLTETSLKAYSVVDSLSIRYAQIYRSAYVFNYAAAAAAVLLALTGLLLAPAYKPLLLAGEIILIDSILFVIVRGVRGKWHQRWLAYRRLSETLRQLRILSLVAAAARLDRPGIRATRARDWVGWYARGIEREISVPNLAVGQSYLGAVRDAVRTAELKPQIDYNRRNTRAMEAAGARLQLAGTILFLTTLAICVGYLSFFFLEREAALKFREWSIFLMALLPTAGAAIHAISAQGDFQSVAARSAETAGNLEALDTALRLEPLEFARLADRIEKFSDLMMADVAEWHVLFRSRPLSLPA